MKSASGAINWGSNPSAGYKAELMLHAAMIDESGCIIYCEREKSTIKGRYLHQLVTKIG